MKIICFTLVWHTIFSEMLHLKIQKNADQNSPTRMFSTSTFFLISVQNNKISIWKCSK